ncbi:MAG: flavodoxin domain-containing protein [Actinomycetota bacterium]
MSAVIVYESMFGNTRSVAEALARGIGHHTKTTIVNVNDAGTRFPDADLVLVGGPTHIHGLSSPTTREEAERWSHDPAKNVALAQKVPGIGIREWLAGLAGTAGEFVAFDTRADAAAVLTGSAAKHIRKSLTKAGGHAFADDESFTMRNNQIDTAELVRAERLGEGLGSRLASDLT